MMKTKNTPIALSLRKPLITPSKSALLLGLSSTALFAATGVNAQQADEPIVLDTMHIEERTSDTNPYAEAGAPYKAKISGDRRHVKDLAKTPQTISVLTQTAIQESGKTDLSEILAAQPGITLGTGENGNAFGDRYIIRGHEARSDVFVDGMRDPGMTTRESFATEQVEVTKGPSSTFAGRGSTGGAVNSITKQASTEYNFNKVQAGLGTDNYQRVALDSNVKINDEAAIRANLVYSDKDVPDRGPADKERFGIAVAGSYKASEKLDLAADLYYLKAKDSPDLGSYHLTNSTIAHDIPSYVQDEDFLESEVQVFTLSAGYEVNKAVRIENSMRYGTTENGYVTTGSSGVLRDATDPTAPGVATITIEGRAHTGWQEVDYFADQLNVFFDQEIADTKHQFIFGAEYSDIAVLNGAYDVQNGPTNCIVPGRSFPGFPAAPPAGAYCILDASGNEIDNLNSVIDRTITKTGEDSDYSVKTFSLSVMDTITFNEQWSVFLGLRIDDFDYENILSSGGVATTYDYSDTLFNGHVGAVYQLNENGNFYFTYSTSSNINGGESDVGGSCGYGGLCGGDNQQVQDSKPEQTENIELGTKWNVFNNKLLLTAAIFQITKDDVMESIGSDDYASTGNLNTGKNRVKGIEVSAVGNITEALSLQFGASMMDSEILASYNDGVHIADGFFGPSVTSNDVGKSLANFADDSAYLQLRYQITPDISFGGTATYSSKMYVGQPDSAAGNFEIPSYSVFDLFANYNVNEQLNLRLNIGNVTDKDYYLAGYRSGGFVYIGNARNTQLTVEYDF